MSNCDKQIIDGCDVSGCEFFETKAQVMQCHMGALTQRCKAQNCYYKQLKRKEKSEEKLVKQIQTICDFINNRPETFKGVNGSVDKIITDYAERKEQECETMASQLDFEVQKKECLEQECKKKSWEIGNLGYKIKNQRKEINIRLEQLDQLKAELEQEKALKETYLACYKAKHEDIEGKLFKLKQTLTEIKEIVFPKNQLIITDSPIILKIQQKISEVGND